MKVKRIGRLKRVVVRKRLGKLIKVKRGINWQSG